jgi:two-component system CheB/CheR fusion protein
LPQPDQDTAVENLIRYIHESRGVDFGGYKRTSFRRRITLRMEHLRVDSFADYHGFLEAHPEEFVDLLNTVLINVTSFFRDPDAWDALKDSVLPRLIEPGRGRDQLRVWSVGCATGEEPYSLAILLREQLGTAEFSWRVKIYATDLDEAALDTARHASYLPRDVEGVPPALLAKYFVRTSNHYLVSRDLRKAVIFGRHNIVHDAPISCIDLLVCRNLLIYLETATQNLVLPRLRCALVEDGCLFLGKAETQLARSKLFTPIGMKHTGCFVRSRRNGNGLGPV